MNVHLTEEIALQQLRDYEDAAHTLKRFANAGVPAGGALRAVRASLHDHIARQVGDWFTGKYRHLAADSGHRRTAHRLRKDGVPLEVALLILFGTDERFTDRRGVST